MLVRPEARGDREAVYAVNCAAFESAAEADLVNTLRERALPVISLVAEDKGKVVGHVMFSPAVLTGHPEISLMGLAPMAVIPSSQRQGIGSALVRRGLEHCREIGVHAVFVLGHPAYYPRFGFLPASRFGIDSEYDVPEDVFMILELESGILKGKSGRVKYHAAFGSM